MVQRNRFVVNSNHDRVVIFRFSGVEDVPVPETHDELRLNLTQPRKLKNDPASALPRIPASVFATSPD